MIDLYCNGNESFDKTSLDHYPDALNREDKSNTKEYRSLLTNTDIEEKKTDEIFFLSHEISHFQHHSHIIKLNDYYDTH
jgi:hypothetical protein